jgi:hypothetical protein
LGAERLVVITKNYRGLRIRIQSCFEGVVREAQSTEASRTVNQSGAKDLVAAYYRLVGSWVAFACLWRTV